MIDINYKRFLTRMLPYHKRQVNRLKLFYWPFLELQNLFDAFKIFRNESYYLANSSGQVLALQALLNKKVAEANNAILVTGYSDSGIWIQLSSEDGEAYMVQASLLAEDGETVDVALEGEVLENSNFDFYVYCPAAVNVGEVTAWVDKYKIAGKRYQIIQA